SPKETLFRTFDSPVPTQTTSGLLGASAMSPIESVPWRSKIGFQVTPPLVVFHKPPDALATYTTLGSPGTPSTSATRPPMTAGPMLRYSRRENASSIGDFVGPFPFCAKALETSRQITSRGSGNRMFFSLG